MSTPRLLPGPSFDDSQHERDEKLQKRIRDLEFENQRLNDDLQSARADAKQFSRAVLGLRSILNPLYNGLRQIYGEMDTVGVDSADITSSSVTNSSFWETQKRRFPGKAAQIIDLLLERPMSVMQIVTAGRMDRQTVYNYIGKLSKAGLVEKNNNLFTLKEL